MSVRNKSKDQKPVSPKNNRRQRLFFDRKSYGCVVAGHVGKIVSSKNYRSRLLFFDETGLSSGESRRIVSKLI